MDKIDLNELERLAKAATPGPLKYRTISKTITVILADSEPLCATKYSHNQEHDAAYITAACNAVPELIARVRELEAENRTLGERLCETEHDLTEALDKKRRSGAACCRTGTRKQQSETSDSHTRKQSACTQGKTYTDGAAPANV